MGSGKEYDLEGLRVIIYLFILQNNKIICEKRTKNRKIRLTKEGHITAGAVPIFDVWADKEGRIKPI